MAKKRPSTPAPPDVAVDATCNSLAALARAVGVDKSTITRRAKRSDWPVSRTPPFDADDVAEVVDYLHEGDSNDGDELKRAQAVKAKVLAARYLLDMARELGQIGLTQAEVCMTALDTTSTIHFRATQHRLGDILRDRGGIEPYKADAEAEDFARWFYGEFARTLVTVMRAHEARDDSMPVLVRRLEKLTRELSLLPDVDPQLIENIREAMPDVDDTPDDGDETDG